MDSLDAFFEAVVVSILASSLIVIFAALRSNEETTKIRIATASTGYFLSAIVALFALKIAHPWVALAGSTLVGIGVGLLETRLRNEVGSH